MKQNNIDLPIFNKNGEHVGYIDIFSDVDKSTIQDSYDSDKLIIFTEKKKAENIE